MPIRIHRTAVLIIAGLFSSHAIGIGEPEQPALHLMPMPKSLIQAQDRLSIDSTFDVCLTGHGDPRVPAAAARLLRRLQRKTGIPLSMNPIADPKKATLEIHCAGPGELVQSLRADESYTLDVTEQSARLAAPSPIGILRGLETFLQLISTDDKSFFAPAVQIKDEPRFCWRGLLIDVSRHWEPAEIIKRNLDAMAAVKMNVLHWHLSDDQGFRVESRRFPKLQLAASEGNYYTQREVREIIDYARDRGIRIIPEFDMPGHTTAWLAAYPELASASGPYSIERAWGVFDPCMDPTSKKLYDFLNSFIDEMAGLFPDEYFHIGGDEVNGRQWNASSRIQAFKVRKNLPDNAALQAYFNQRLQQILEKHRKKMIGWDEILHPDLPKTVVVQSWRGHSYLARSARQGYAGVLSYGYYLDHMRPASFHYDNDPLGKEAASLADQEKSLVLGGEACMWSEFVNLDNIESRIWPRTAAIAERLWSPREISDVQDMYRRLDFINGELDAMGLMHRANPIKMLQRMSGVENTASLKMLADLLKPAGLGVRVKTRTYSSLVPLNRMVDAVLPESEITRKLGDIVARAVANPAGSADDFPQIRRLLSAWKDNSTGLKPVIGQSFLLKEIEPLAEMLSESTETGLQALDYLESRQRPPEGWKEKAALTLERAEKAHSEMLITIAPALKALTKAASAIP
jgi:hexosaminidase